MINKRRIGLYGIKGVYNFGCEAIVRGAVQLINEIYENPEIIYFSYNYTYDKKNLEDIQLNVHEIERSKNIIVRIINKICKVFRTSIRPMFIDEKEIFEQVDEIWSIGGDIYTIPEFKRNNKVYDYYNSLVDFCNRAIESGKNVVLYGASVGPFGDYIKAIDYYRANLSKYKLILCREMESIGYLRSIGVENTTFFPDPAFQVVKENRTLYTRKYIGLNLSPLSLNELYGSRSEESYKGIVELVKNVIDDFDNDILLIPHVISKDENDDDLRFMQQIIRLLPDEYINRIRIADYTQGFMGIKEQIRACRFVVGARMHCCINAIVENVPAIFLTYSQKSVGMCDYIYGDTKWLINIKNMDTNLIKKMKEMNSIVDELQSFLEKRNKDIWGEYTTLTKELLLRVR